MQSRQTIFDNEGSSTSPRQDASLAQKQPIAAAAGWGQLPALILSSSLGLLAIAASMARAALGLGGGEALFWLGIVTVFAPVLWRQASDGVPRRERIGLILCLGLSLFAVKLLRSPAGFVFHDEFPHWRTANDIVQSGHLFLANPLQPVSALYPGLEIVTAALVHLTGLTISQAGTVLLGIARLIAVVAVYLIYERVGRSERLAGIGAVFYMAYPNFVFWSSQYAYESLAVPLALVLIYSLVLFATRRLADRRIDRLAQLALIALALIAIAAIHHLTSYALATFLLMVAIVSRRQTALVRTIEHGSAALRRLVLRKDTAPVEKAAALNPSVWWWAGSLALIGCVAWLGLVGREVIPYLAPHLKGAVAAVAGLILREGSSKTLFSGTGSALVTPAWERVATFGSVLFITLALPIGLWQIWRRHRADPVALAFALGALAFPVTLVLRLTSAGSEIGNRALDFLFLPLGFVLAAALSALWPEGRARRLNRGPILVTAVVIFLGGVALGMPAWARLPGTYLVGGDTRAIQPESLAAARWSQQILGPHNKLIADDTNGLLLGSYGGQDPVVGLSWVYLSPNFRAESELVSIRSASVRYIVVDRRLSSMLPKTGFYFESNEPHPPGRQAIDPTWLAKFGHVPYLSPVLDSGDIVVYDTRQPWTIALSAEALRGTSPVGMALTKDLTK